MSRKKYFNHFQIKLTSSFSISRFSDEENPRSSLKCFEVAGRAACIACKVKNASEIEFSKLDGCNPCSLRPGRGLRRGPRTPRTPEADGQRPLGETIRRLLQANFVSRFLRTIQYWELNEWTAVRRTWPRQTNAGSVTSEGDA